MLAREGDVRLPTVYGVVITQEAPYKELMLIERLRGVSVEAPTRTPERWTSLMDHVVESVLLWHRIYSHGCVGSVIARRITIGSVGTNSGWRCFGQRY